MSILNSRITRMKFFTDLKEELVNSDSERFNPKIYGGDPPICVIKENTSEFDDKK